MMMMMTMTSTLLLLFVVVAQQQSCKYNGVNAVCNPGNSGCCQGSTTDYQSGCASKCICDAPLGNGNIGQITTQCSWEIGNTKYDAPQGACCVRLGGSNFKICDDGVCAPPPTTNPTTKVNNLSAIGLFNSFFKYFLHSFLSYSDLFR